MKPIISADTTQFVKYLNKHRFTRQELLNIRGNGAKVIINNQRKRVPVDLGTTKTSINSHIIEATSEKVVDEIGPETDYSPYIEFGTGKKAEDPSKVKNPDWPGMSPQPFVRPSVMGADAKEAENAMEVAFATTIARKA